MAIKISWSWSCFKEKGRFFRTSIVSGFSTTGDIAAAEVEDDEAEADGVVTADDVAVGVTPRDEEVGVEGEKGMPEKLVPKLSGPPR